MTDVREIEVILNGEPRRLTAGGSIADLLLAIGLDPAKVAIERNRAIVARSTLDKVAVEPGDAFEIVHFVGGG